jgi:hypothetical protein
LNHRLQLGSTVGHVRNMYTSFGQFTRRPLSEADLHLSDNDNRRSLRRARRSPPAFTVWRLSGPTKSDPQGEPGEEIQWCTGALRNNLFRSARPRCVLCSMAPLKMLNIPPPNNALANPAT